MSPRRNTQKRAENRSLWVNEPLQMMIRNELDRRDWSPSDLGRAIGSQPSLISRWFQGQRPNTESLERIAKALDLDVRQLLVLAKHMPPDPEEDNDDPELASLILTIRKAHAEGHLVGERRLMLLTLLDWMRDHEPATPPAVTTPAIS